MAPHRTVAAPFHAKRIDGRPACPWCGEACLDAIHARRIWHPECVTIYRIANFSSDQRDFCRDRDKGICAKCGVNAGHKFEADHIIPLWLVDRTKEGWLKYFGGENLQTLCPDCHKAKSKIEAGQRAKIKRLQCVKVKPAKKAGMTFRRPNKPFIPTPVKMLT